MNPSVSVQDRHTYEAIRRLILRNCRHHAGHIVVLVGTLMEEVWERCHRGTIEVSNGLKFKSWGGARFLGRWVKFRWDHHRKKIEVLPETACRAFGLTNIGRWPKSSSSSKVSPRKRSTRSKHPRFFLEVSRCTHQMFPYQFTPEGLKCNNDSNTKLHVGRKPDGNGNLRIVYTCPQCGATRTEQSVEYVPGGF